jgi:Xaa-Pro aminopeptidase
METYDLAGMLAANPTNIYYLSNTMPLATKMQWDVPALATLPRDAKEPTFLIAHAFQILEMLKGERWVPEVIPYTGAQDWQEYLGDDAKTLTDEPLAAPHGFAVSDGASLGPWEQAWADSGKNHQPSPTPEWALARAMRESGITSGRVAVDDMRIAYLLKRIGVADDIEFVDGENLFRRLRYIKSPVEVDYLRIAGRNNHTAALATARALQPGMGRADVEDLFRLEPGMVITVDLPYLEIGFGAGHNEDLLLITEDGFEALHEVSENLLII